MQGEDPGWFWNSWTTVTPVSSGALIWKLSIVKSQIALFECSQTKLTGSIGTPEAPDQQQCLVLGPRCDTPEMRWSTPRTHVFVFGQSSKHRCALKVAWLRKKYVAFVKKVILQKIIVGLAKSLLNTIKMQFAATKMQLNSTKMPDLWHSQLQKTKMIMVSGHGDLLVATKYGFVLWQNSAYPADSISILFGNSILYQC